MAFLIDSNIIIYSYSNEYQYLRDIITDDLSNISEISRVEVLGYHALKADERKYFDDIFIFVPIILPFQEIFNKAIEVRVLYNLKLGDSIIAATALVHDLILYTRNVSDFNKIAGLKMVNPIK